MSSKYQEPAFPSVNHSYGGGGQGGSMYSTPGMTLRDYFAARINIDIEQHPLLAEMLMGRAPPEVRFRMAYSEYWFEAEARTRYMKADAMLRARSE